MTFSELIEYLGDHSPFPVLDGDIAQTLEKARAGTHSDVIMGEILRNLWEGAQWCDLAASIDRATATLALGPLRLRYMKDDAPVQGFRMVERIVHDIDSAFNDEALKQKYHQ